MLKIKQLFCKHAYVKTNLTKARTIGNYDYFYHYTLYECKKCDHSYSILNYYTKTSHCRKCLFEEDSVTTEPCKSCIEKT